MIECGFLLPAGLALAGVLSGLAYRIAAVGRSDTWLMQRINRAQWPGLVDRLLGLMRGAGTTLFFLAVILLVAYLLPSAALGLGLAAVVAELTAKALKAVIRRPRPLDVDTGVVVRLPRRPIDQSFPSADAMRAAFLAGLTLAPAGWSWWVTCLAMLAAVVIGIARVRSGAHYPLDVMAGLAIGLAAVLAWTSTL